jgi:hypothetical protein
MLEPTRRESVWNDCIDSVVVWRERAHAKFIDNQEVTKVGKHNASLVELVEQGFEVDDGSDVLDHLSCFFSAKMYTFHFLHPFLLPTTTVTCAPLVALLVGILEPVSHEDHDM